MQTSVFCDVKRSVLLLIVYFLKISHVICMSLIKLFDLMDQHSSRQRCFWRTKRPQAWYAKTSLFLGAWGITGKYFFNNQPHADYS